MNDRQREMQRLYHLLAAPADLERRCATPPSLLPWLGYAALGLLTVIGLTAGVLWLLSIG